MPRPGRFVVGPYTTVECIREAGEFGRWELEVEMAELSSESRRRIIALCAVGLAIGAWVAMGSLQGAEDAEGRVTSDSASDSIPPDPATNSSSHAPAISSRARLDHPAPDYRIAESGRLALEATSLPEGGVLALGLALAEEAGGVEPLAVRVVSVDGRVLDTTAVRTDAAGGDVQLEIDADWLQPGNYMIQIKTAEKVAFPLRRYVLEVR